MDRTLRNLQRRAALGDERAAVRLFLAEGKAGRFDFDRLRLAAYLGHGPTREVLGDLAGSPPAELGTWAAGLAYWGRLVAVVASLTAVRCIVTAGSEAGSRTARRPGGLNSGEHVTFGDLLPCIDAWVACPCTDHVSAVRNRRRHLRRSVERARRVLDWARGTRTVEGRSLARAGGFAGEAVYALTGAVVTRRSLVTRELERAVWASRNALLQLGLTAPQAEDELRSALKAALLPLAFEEGSGGVAP